MAQLLDCTPDEYHQRDGFSSSLATTLLKSSPLHAWTQHPLLGAKGKKPTKSMNRGTVGHRLVLGKGKDYEIALDSKGKPVRDWRTNDAKDARAKIEAAGKVAVLKEDLDEWSEMAASIIAELEKRGIVLNGRSEQAIEWHEETEHGLVLCRAMLDHVWLDDNTILDLKIVENAAPEKVMRSAEEFGYAVQQHAYRRALETLDPSRQGRAKFLFAFCEPERPFAINLCEPDGMMREIGARRWHRAVNAWGRCLAENKFPAYGEGVNRLSVPQWALSREEEIQAEAAIAGEERAA